MQPMHVYTRASTERRAEMACAWHARTCSPCMYTRVHPPSGARRWHVHGMLEHAAHACIHACIHRAARGDGMCMACSNMQPMHVYTRASTERRAEMVCAWHARTCSPCMYTRVHPPSDARRWYVHGMLEHAAHACIHACIHRATRGDGMCMACSNMQPM